MAVKDDVCGEMGRHLGLMAYEQWAILASGSKRMILDNVPYGCDGYLSKPIDVATFAARVRSMLRTSRSVSAPI